MALISYYLKFPEEAKAIARAGQARTLKEHTYTNRMKETGKILLAHLDQENPVKKPARKPDQVAVNVSSGYKQINQSEITANMTTAWQSKEIPAKQRALVQQELAAMYAGTVPAHFQALIDLLKPVVFPNCSILEIGCASGYYYEIMKHLLKIPFAYTGVDYSQPLINLAKECYPSVPDAQFFVADGANLFFPNRGFDIVISGCVLLHVPNYKQHIMETARVAKDIIVAARTPICRKRPTVYQKKIAYDVETVELIFNEQEFFKEFEINRFKLATQIEYMVNPEGDFYLISELFNRV
jgi:SAM-dependent methyltransferase